MRRISKTIIISAFISIFILIKASAQVSVLPPAVFLDPKTNSGFVFLQNKEDEPKEVKIDFKFGYLRYDDKGVRQMEFNDKNAEKWSLIPFIRAFPKKMIIPPNGRQMVRFMVKPTAAMTDGTYWTRFIVTSKDPRKQVDTTTGKNVKVNLELALSTSTIVIMERGKCNSGVSIKSQSFDITNDKIILKLTLDRTGNTPFWGTASFEVKDMMGNAVESKEETVALYYSGTVPFTFERQKYTPGRYKIDMTLSNERDEIPKEYRLPFSPIDQTYTFNIP